MYIRIQNGIIRYRISREEASKLIAGELLADEICLSSNFKLVYRITVTDEAGNFLFSQENNSLQLNVNRQELMDEIEKRPSKNGIKVVCSEQIQTYTSAYLEVDIKKVKKG